MTTKLISIIIPCRNEERYIENCICSVMGFALPDGVDIEVLVVDGMSKDATINILMDLKTKYANLQMLSNPGVFQSFAINLALKVAKGQYIMRLDAHSTYPNNYLKNCYQTALHSNADNVGGLVVTLAGGETYQANLVQALTTHPFGVGNSGFRTGIKEEGPVDTVPFGFFKREIFDKIGLFDERLIRAQDYEFNRRIIAAEGVVWSNSEIYSEYYNQPTLTAFYKKQFFKEAPYNAYLWYVAPYAFAYRHAISGVFASGIIGGALLSPFSNWILWPFLAIICLYFSLAIASAVQQSIRFKDIRHAFLLPFCFFLYHFIHGLGVLLGLFMLAIGNAPVQKLKEPWSGASKFRAFPL